MFLFNKYSNASLLLEHLCGILVVFSLIFKRSLLSSSGRMEEAALPAALLSPTTFNIWGHLETVFADYFFPQCGACLAVLGIGLSFC